MIKGRGVSRRGLAVFGRLAPLLPPSLIVRARLCSQLWRRSAASPNIWPPPEKSPSDFPEQQIRNIVQLKLKNTHITKKPGVIW